MEIYHEGGKYPSWTVEPVEKKKSYLLHADHLETKIHLKNI